ncbi:uncharacterized protein LOC134571058 [Pelobates fuscus]|uniref:uncharacterized protein LOC134571058 n=1 Tax=Pelobates fuscus TaxID=191477 RepID=UPI002FE49245
MAITKHSKHAVGIFSRDGDVNYVWLVKLLLSQFFNSVVDEVRSVYISNIRSNFLSELRNFSFAILYHTQKRGRLNVTNVTDSLYDEELEDLHNQYGKKNVIVLMDDLEDNSQNKKDKILREQYDIKDKACELFLISEMEKESCNLNSSNQEWSEDPISPRLQEEHRSMSKKRAQIKDIIAEASPHTVNDKDSYSRSSSYRSPGRRYSDTDSQFTESMFDSQRAKDFTDNNSQITAPSSNYNSGIGAHLLPPSSGAQAYVSDDTKERQNLKRSSDDAENPNHTPRKHRRLSNKAVFIIIGVVGLILLITLISILATL